MVNPFWESLVLALLFQNKDPARVGVGVGERGGFVLRTLTMGQIHESSALILTRAPLLAATQFTEFESHSGASFLFVLPLQ